MGKRDYVIDEMISAKSIAARVEALAREISDHFAGTDKLVVVGLLRGSFIFIADLVREIDLPVEVDFLEVSSYGDATESSREVRILKDLRGEIEGRDVLVVEDIVDTGHTLASVLDVLRTRRPARLEVCALLDKPSRREVDVKARWTGFEIPDRFVVGYGIDCGSSRGAAQPQPAVGSSSAARATLIGNGGCPRLDHRGARDPRSSPSSTRPR
jgi:hypoxanthine phosphoribosyltransferase